jgi:hypothetical protein
MINEGSYNLDYMLAEVTVLTAGNKLVVVLRARYDDFHLKENKFIKEKSYKTPPESSYENNNDISNNDKHQTITDEHPNFENDGTVCSISNAHIMDVNNSTLSINSTGSRIFDIDFNNLDYMLAEVTVLTDGNKLVVVLRARYDDFHLKENK